MHIVAIPEPKSLGFGVIVIIAFQVEHQHLSSVLDALKSREDVKCLYATSGRYDILALMWFSSSEQLYKFMEEDMAKLEGVKGTETFVCMHAVKTFWSG